MNCSDSLFHDASRCDRDPVRYAVGGADGGADGGAGGAGGDHGAAAAADAGLAGTLKTINQYKWGALSYSTYLTHFVCGDHDNLCQWE